MGSPDFPGETLIEQISGLMMRLFDDLARDLEIEAVQSQSSSALAQTNRFLTEAERLIASATVKDLNAHQLIHIQELTNNYLGTVVAVVEVLSEIQASEDCNQKSFQLHPDLCGILCDVDRLRRGSRHQRARVPYAPPRVGHEVTYEEIANLYRTSRVNIRELLHSRCFAKLRVRLKPMRE